MTLEASLRILRTEPKRRDAWEVIYVEEQPRLLIYVSSLLITFQLPATTANDIVHDVMVNLLERWDKIAPGISSVEHLSRYLRKSCRNLLIDRYRNARTATHLLVFLSGGFGEVFHENTATQRAIFLDEVIKALPPECARLLTRYVSNDLTPAELAEEQGIAIGTFYTRWHRCVQKARDLYYKRPE
jgi:RNA polymerase sigma factor (sigma-70 family)